MKIQKTTIHNFRSIIHQVIDCKDFTLFVGENNSGKTNIITALRAFYENEGYKYDKKSDFPKLTDTTDSESWIELEFITTNEEQEKIKDEYKRDDNILIVRRYFESKNIEVTNLSVPGHESGDLLTLLESKQNDNLI